MLLIEISFPSTEDPFQFTKVKYKKAQPAGYASRISITLSAETGLPRLVGVQLELGVGQLLKALLGLVLHVGGGILPHRLHPGLAAVQGGIGLGGGEDDVTVARLQVKGLLAVLRLGDDKLAHC